MDRVREQLNMESFYRAGLTGAGVGVAVLDTGIFFHRDLEGRIAAAVSIFDNERANARISNGSFVAGTDDNGHGTHVAGIIAGDGRMSREKWRGIAPGAHIVSVKVLRRDGLGSAEGVMEGIDWVIRNREKYHIRIANISFGRPSEGLPLEQQLIQKVEALWDLGVAVVAAAGNQGPQAGSITIPGSSRKVITVGASDDHIPVRMGGGRREGYSGCGPIPESCVVKPEVVAPAGRIMSLNFRHHDYTAKSGTSMAAPIVAGVIALLLAEHPDMTPKEVKRRLYETSTDLGLPKEKQGWGMICPEKLLKVKLL